MTLNFTIIGVESGAYLESRFFAYYKGYGLNAKVTGGDERVSRVYIEVREKDIHNDEELKKEFLKAYEKEIERLDEDDRLIESHRLLVESLLGKVIDP